MDFRSFWAGVITGLGLRGFRFVPDETTGVGGVGPPSDTAYDRRDFLAGLVVGMSL